jgi:hypothetical protein
VDFFPTSFTVFTNSTSQPSEKQEQEQEQEQGQGLGQPERLTAEPASGSGERAASGAPLHKRAKRGNSAAAAAATATAAAAAAAADSRRGAEATAEGGGDLSRQDPQDSPQEPASAYRGGAEAVPPFDSFSLGCLFRSVPVAERRVLQLTFPLPPQFGAPLSDEEAHAALALAAATHAAHAATAAGGATPAARAWGAEAVALLRGSMDHKPDQVCRH